MIKQIPTADVMRIVQEHGITTESIPSSGLYVIDRNRKILIAVRRDTGEIIGLDLSVYNDQGVLLPDAAAVNENTLNAILRDLPNALGAGSVEVIKWLLIAAVAYIVVVGAGNAWKRN